MQITVLLAIDLLIVSTLISGSIGQQNTPTKNKVIVRFKPKPNANGQNQNVKIVKKPAPINHNPAPNALRFRIGPNSKLTVNAMLKNQSPNHVGHAKSDSSSPMKLKARFKIRSFTNRQSTKLVRSNNHPNANNNQLQKQKVKIIFHSKQPPTPSKKMNWKPKPVKLIFRPGPKYSGWKPPMWKNTTKLVDETGAVVNRTSERKFSQYMSEIFGEADVEHNDLLSPEELNGRELVDPGEYPHMAAIGVIRDNEDIIDWKCGGSLISRRYVLTAAHCCSFGGEHPTHVELGSIDLRKRHEDRNGSVTMEIEEVTLHPYYSDDAYYYDIGLLKLSEDVQFSFKIRPAQLWPLEYVPYIFAFACGYGATAFGKVQTNVLTEMNLDLIGNEDCNKDLPVLPETPFGILDNQICAKDLDGLVDTCQGDSGGPLQLNLPGRRRPRHSLIGIVSYGVFCGSRYPGVYTRIYSYMNWIESIVWPDTYRLYNPEFVPENNNQVK